MRTPKESTPKTVQGDNTQLKKKNNNPNILKSKKEEVIKNKN